MFMFSPCVWMMNAPLSPVVMSKMAGSVMAASVMPVTCMFNTLLPMVEGARPSASELLPPHWASVRMPREQQAADKEVKKGRVIKG